MRVPGFKVIPASKLYLKNNESKVFTQPLNKPMTFYNFIAYAIDKNQL